MGTVGTENKHQNPRRNHFGLDMYRSGWKTCPGVKRDKRHLKYYRTVTDRGRYKTNTLSLPIPWCHLPTFNIASMLGERGDKRI